MGITRHITRIHLSTRTATADDRVAPAGTPLWVITWTVGECGGDKTFTAPCLTEASARRMVANLLADRLPGLSESDVYSEELGAQSR